MVAEPDTKTPPHQQAAFWFPRRVTTPSTWSLARDGLIVTMDPYDVLSCASGTSVISIPWADLAPFLAPNAPIPN
jgi:hypothetical protein